MRRNSVIRAAETYEAKFPGRWGISVASLEQASVAAIAAAANLPHPELQKSTWTRILEARSANGAQLKLDKTGPNREHYTLVLPASPADDECWDLLRDVFDPPEPNPAAWSVSG